MNRLDALRYSAGLLPEESDAGYALAYVLGISKKEILAFPDRELTEAEEKKLDEIIRKRNEGIPLAYILGEWYFMDLVLKVDGSVLIPRQDTEVLCEAAIAYLKATGRRKVLDICTGSGCIALSVKSAVPDAEVTASDISPTALKTASLNAEMNGLDIKLVCSDLFSRIGGKYDVITANPPYIPEKGFRDLPREIREHEPRLALVADEEGLGFYKRIAAAAKDRLLGRLFLEIGYDQAEAVTGLLKENGFRNITVSKDLAGNDRLVTADV